MITPHRTDTRWLAWEFLIPHPTHYDCVDIDATLALDLPERPDTRTSRTLVTQQIDTLETVDLARYDAVVVIGSDVEHHPKLRTFPLVKSFAYLPKRSDPRWLIPLDSPKIAAASLQMYRPHRRKARIMKRAMTMTLRANIRPLIRDTITIASRRPSPTETFIRKSFPNTTIAFGIYAGRAGDQRTISGLALDESGQECGYFKMATSAHRRTILRNETGWLERLANSPLAGTIPEILGVHEDTDRTLLLTAPGPAEFASWTFSPAHRAWLAELSKLEPRHLTLSESAMWADIQQTKTMLYPSLTDDWHQRFDSTLDRIETTLGSARIPFGIAHGDFTPWNIRRFQDGRLFVLDWEMAKDEVIAGYDIFHFHFMKQILFAPSLRLQKTGLLISRWFDAAKCISAKHNQLAAFLALYLLDLAHQYLGSSGLAATVTGNNIHTTLATIMDTSDHWWTGPHQ